MSGIYGFSAKDRVSNLFVLDKMLRAIPPPYPSVNHQWTTQEGNVGLGTIHPERTSKSTCFAEDPSNGIYCIPDQEIFQKGYLLRVIGSKLKAGAKHRRCNPPWSPFRKGRDTCTIEKGGDV